MSSFPGPGTTAGIYVRRSSNLQNPLSCQDQERLCRRYLERFQWIVKVVESDDSLSGTSTLGRAGYRNILKRAENGEFQLLLAESQDRLTRSQRDTHELLELLEASGVILCTVHDGIVDEVKATFNGLQSAQEVKKLRERVKRGQAGSVRNGGVVGLAYGHRLTRSVAVPTGGRELHPDRAPIAKRILEDFAAGVSTHAICAALNREGHRTARGALWRPSVLTGTRSLGTGLLRNPTYKGEVGWGRTQRKKNPRTGQITTTPGAPEYREVTYHPELRIVSDEVWDAVQARLDKSGEKRLGARKHAVYVFSGLLWCGWCHRPYAMGPGRLYCTGHFTHGICDNRRGVDRPVLEATVLEGLQAQLLQPDLIKLSLQEYLEERERVEAELREEASSGEASIPQLKQAIKNITDQIIAGHGAGFAGDILRSKLEVLGADLKRAERQASAKAELQPVNGSAEEIVSRLKATFQNLQQELQGDEREAVRARELIRSTIKKIIITPVDTDKPDGRGAGPVRLKVEGRLAELLSLADLELGRSVQTDLSALMGQNLAKLRFTFWAEIRQEDNDLGLDPVVIIRRLEEAVRPIRARALLNAVEQASKSVRGQPGYDAKMTRLRSLMKRLREDGIVRRVRLDGTWAWVSNMRPLTNEQWYELDRREDKNPTPTTQPLPLMRVTPPQGHVVIIGRAPDGPEQSP